MASPGAADTLDTANASATPRAQALEGVLAIGDLQGCCDSLTRLLSNYERNNPAPRRLWLCGDLVNRGPQSLATLRWAYRNRQRLVTVLGNHDLHLLAASCGARAPGKGDTIAEILAAPDRDELLDWLRARPLAHLEHGHLLVHAGVLPGWSAAMTLALAAEVQVVLRGPDWRDFMSKMYGDRPDRWDDGLAGVSRLRVIVNALTRMRFCSADGRMEFDSKQAASVAPAGYMPWFEVPGRATTAQTVVFGHWSTLGLLERPNLLGLDTGCVWGGALTAVRLSDRARFQESCPRAAKPGPG